MIKRILSLALSMAAVSVANANNIELRLEAAHLKPKSTVGNFVNGSGNDRVAGPVQQEMASMSAFRLSAAKKWNNYVSFIGSVYSPIKGVMSPKTTLSNASFNSQSDPYGVAGKFNMLLSQFGGEYTLHLGDDFHPFIGGGLAFAYFYNGGTDTLLNADGHTVEDFDIKNKITWYATAGASYDITENVSLIGSINYTHLKTQAAYQFSSYQGGGATREDAREELELKINPIILSLGVSFKF